MNKDNSNNQSPDDNDPEQEKWIPKKEIKKKYDVSDRNLTYWRGEGKIRYKNIRNRTFYIEEDVRIMAEKRKRPKKYFGIRKAYIIRKLKNIDPVLAGVIIALGFGLANGLKMTSRIWWIVLLNNPAFFMILLVGIIYGSVKLIKYIWKRHFNKDNPGK